MILRTSEWGSHGTAADISVDKDVSPKRSDPIPSWANVGRVGAASFFVENSLIV